MYDASTPTKASVEDVLAVMGKSAEITLTGKFVDFRETKAGVAVAFEIDKRWGFKEGFQMVMDLEAFEVEK